MPGSNSRPNVSEGYMVTSELPGRPAIEQHGTKLLTICTLSVQGTRYNRVVLQIIVFAHTQHPATFKISSLKGLLSVSVTVVY